jgi:hypothetical protein
MPTPAQNKKIAMAGWKRSVAAHPALYGGFLVLAAAAAVFFLLIVPGARELQAGGASSVADTNDQIAAAQKKLASENGVVSAIAALSPSDLDKLDYALPGEPDSPGALAQLAAIARDAGGVIASVDFSVPQDQTAAALPHGVSGMDAAVNVGGMDYGKFKLFLADLESNLRFFDVQNMVFSGNADAVSLTLKTYFKP